MNALVERNEPGHADSGGRVIVPFQTDDEMRSVLARVAGWQPMETAPMHCIIYTSEYGACEGLRMDGGEWAVATFNRSLKTANPTHWQPLPAPPVQP